jgi:hypothetical protein
MKVVLLLLIGVLSVCGLHAYNRHVSRFVHGLGTKVGKSRIDMVSTDNSASTSETDNKENDGVSISMPKVHIGGSVDSGSHSDSVNEENKVHMVTGAGGAGKVKNLKKAPGQDLPEVLKSWNELQGLSEREMLANDDPSFQRDSEALKLAYRR